MSLAHAGDPGDQEEEDHKSSVRARVWRSLRAVALPDSRFHFDFSSFIADFAGSAAACDALFSRCLPPAVFAPGGAACVFITPDNCLEHLRFRALAAGVRVLTTTYGIRRGFWLLDPSAIQQEEEPGLLRYAATLDGMEKVGRPVSLREIAAMGLDVGLMVTGTGAINGKGIRFGKGHGFFDLEWAMLHSVGVVSAATTTAAVVHDCQVLEEELVPEVFDTVCDLIVTPTRVIDAHAVSKPTCGILWEKLAPGMLDDIPPLQELKNMSI